MKKLSFMVIAVVTVLSIIIAGCNREPDDGTTQPTVDTTAPSLTVTSPVDGSTNTSGTVNVVGTASDAGGFGANGVVLFVNGTNLGFIGTTSFDTNISLSSGSHTISLQAFDAANNNSEVKSFNVYINTTFSDMTAPTITVTSPVDGSTNTSGSVTVSGSASDNYGFGNYGVVISLNGTNLGYIGTSSFNTNLSLSDGNHTIGLQAFDAVLNSSEAENIMIVVDTSILDTTPPTLSIDVPVSNGITFTNGVTISGSASDNTALNTVEISLTNATSQNLTLSNSSFSKSYNLDAGSYSVVITAIDEAGNSNSTTVSFIIYVSDTTPPIWSINPAAEDITTSSFDLTVTINENGTVYYAVYSDNAGAPDAETLIGGDGALKAGSIVTTAGAKALINDITWSGIADNTAYDVYLVAEDENANIMVAVYKVELTTADSGDVTDPTFTVAPAASNITHNSFNITGTLDEVGTVTYMVVTDGAVQPTSSEITNASTGLYTGKFSVSAGTGFTIQDITWGTIQASTAYDVYVTAYDGNKNLIDTPVKLDVMTTAEPDTTAPTFNTTPTTGSITETSFQINAEVDESGTAYYILVADGSEVPSAGTLKAGTNYSGVTLIDKNLQTVTANTSFTFTISSGVTANTAYDIHIIVEDSSSNMTAVQTVDVTTPDLTAPSFTVAPSSSDEKNNSFDITATLNEDGTVYYLVLTNGSTQPSSEAITNGSSGLKAGNIAVTANTSFTIQDINWATIQASTAYDVYVTARDKSTNLIVTPAKVDVTTTAEPDTTPPTFSTAAAIASLTETSFDVTGTVNEGGNAYLIMVTNGATVPSAGTVKAGTNYSGVTVITNSSQSVTADTGFTFTINSNSGLTVESAYDVHLIVEDSSGNQTAVQSLDVTIPDQTAPSWTTSPVASDLSTTSFDLTAGIGEGGAIYYAVYSDNAGAPTVSELKAGTGALTNGNVSTTGSGDEVFNNITWSGVSHNTAYDIYVVAEDDASTTNVNSIVKVEITTVKAPIFSTGPATANITYYSFDITGSLDEAGDVYYVVVADGATAPTASEVKAGTGSGGTGELTTGSATADTTFNFTGITWDGILPGTAYDAYLVAENATPALQASPTKVDVTLNAQPSGGVYISEICDPANFYSENRYIEIYNDTGTNVDLTGWEIREVENGAEDESWSLSGILLAGQCWTFGNSTATIPMDYSIAWGNTGWNGGTDDGARLYDGSAALIDVCVGADFVNANLERRAIITAPSTTFDAAQWKSEAVSDIAANSVGQHTNSVNDETAPAWDTDPASADIQAQSFDITATADENGTVYFAVYSDGSAVPTPDQVKNGTGTGYLHSSNTAATATVEVLFDNITWAGIEMTAVSYDIYIVAEDGSGNVQIYPSLVEVTTADGTDSTPPTFSTGPTAADQDYSSFDASGELDEQGTVYYVVVADGEADTPTSAQVKAGVDYDLVTVLASGNVSANNTFTFDEITQAGGFDPSTAYDVYFVAEDVNNNLQASATLLNASTTALPQIVISEICDPANNFGNDRYVEIYNAGASGLDISGWMVKTVVDGVEDEVWTNGGSITLAAGDAYSYGDINSSIAHDVTMDWGNTSWNGDTADGAKLYDSNNILIDVCVGDAHADSYVERNGAVTSPNRTYTSAEWTVTGIDSVSPSYIGTHPNTDVTAPTWVSVPVENTTRVNETDIDFTVNEGLGNLYYVVVATGAGNTPTAAQVAAGNDSGGSPAPISGSFTDVTIANNAYTRTITGLSAGTTYDVFMVAEDQFGNLQGDADVKEVVVSTIHELTGVSAVRDSATQATITFNATTSGTIYYVVVADGAAAPTLSEVLAGTGSGGSGQLDAGNQAYTASANDTIVVSSGISTGSAYDIYLALDTTDDLGPVKLDIPLDGSVPGWAAQLFITEVDSDTPGTDVAEIIEIWNNTGSTIDLSANYYYLVFVNGSDDLSYGAERLTNSTGTLPNGSLLVVGHSGVTGLDVELSSSMQNGPDGVVLVQVDAAGDASTEFPTDTDVSNTTFTTGQSHTATKIDAVAYDTGDADDSVLMDVLGVTSQWDENANGNQDTESLQRSNESNWIAATPTPDSFTP